jgi:mycothiol synthase
MATINTDNILIPEAPSILGLSFRHFRGESDYPHMLWIINATKVADRDESSETLDDIANQYAHLTNCDPAIDMLFAEVDGQPVAYSRVTWWIDEASGSYIYLSFGHIHPQWRRKGLGRAMLRHNQRRLHEIAAGHPAEANKLFESFATSFQEGNQTMLEGDGYQPVRRFFFMTRPNLAGVPDLPLPPGLEARPALPEHYQAIWDAFQEAFRDHWGYSKPHEEDYQGWLKSKEFQPELWQVVWDGDQVAGMILNFIHHEENEEYKRKRGYTEGIAVRRPWRRRGLARAMLARSLKMHRELGMTEAALGVDTESLSGANHLYESMGFRPVKIFITYRRPMD